MSHVWYTFICLSVLTSLSWYWCLCQGFNLRSMLEGHEYPESYANVCVCVICMTCHYMEQLSGVRTFPWLWCDHQYPTPTLELCGIALYMCISPLTPHPPQHPSVFLNFKAGFITPQWSKHINMHIHIKLLNIYTYVKYICSWFSFFSVVCSIKSPQTLN